MGVLSYRFDMFPKEDRPQFERLLQKLFTDLSNEIKTIGEHYTRCNLTKKYFGDADYYIEKAEYTLDYAPKSFVAFQLVDQSASWWAHLEAGINDYKQDYLRVFVQTNKPPKKVVWDKLHVIALMGKAEICINAVNGRGEWYDHIPIINFSWPLRPNLRNTIDDLQGIDP